MCSSSLSSVRARFAASRTCSTCCEDLVAFVMPQHAPEHLAEQAHVVSQRLMRIETHPRDPISVVAATAPNRLRSQKCRRHDSLSLPSASSPASFVVTWLVFAFWRVRSRDEAARGRRRAAHVEARGHLARSRSRGKPRPRRRARRAGRRARAALPVRRRAWDRHLPVRVGARRARPRRGA